MEYSELNLDERILRGLSECGYVSCTPVQEKVLEPSFAESDLYVQSQTGTGKTAAFLIPVMQSLLSGAGGRTALVLVPTRELAVQVEEEASKIGRHTGLRFASFYGGVGYDRQVECLRRGVDILIGTPGRVIDLHDSGKMDLGRTAFLVVDEADRMFDMGFYPDLRKLIRFLPAAGNRRTMLFSATLNSYVKNLAWEYTRDAKEIVIEAQNITVDEIEQELIHVSNDDKMALLVGVLAREKPDSVIIFCDTKKMCEIVSKRLRINGVQNEYIIGDLPQSKRLKIMNSFKAGTVRCLVATDVAARGIDVSDLAMVVNYDLPSEAENYVHRIGRTARAGKTGKAYTFCSERDVYSLAPIERYIEKRIPSRVAAADDLGEDKSRDVFIRLDSDGGRAGASGKRPRRSGGRTQAERRQPSRGRRNTGSAQKSGGQKSSEKELSRLASLSSDERLAYFKAKYGGKSSPSERKRPPRGNVPGKNRGGKRPSSAEFSRTKAAPSAQQSPKKAGFFSRLKSLVGRKK